MKTTGFLLVLIGGLLVLIPSTALSRDERAGATAPAAVESQVGGPATEKPKGPAPLVVDKSAPLLLLDEPTEKAAVPETAALVADNAACFVCHANYKSETLTQTHAKARMGCVDCHGKSYAHRNDENNTTPPEKMFAADEIDRACQQCHPRHDVPAAKVVLLGVQRGLAKAEPKTIVCTDCHGDHRLAQRTVRWDKKTGKLLPRSK